MNREDDSKFSAMTTDWKVNGKISFAFIFVCVCFESVYARRFVLSYKCTPLIGRFLLECPEIKVTLANQQQTKTNQ